QEMPCEVHIDYRCNTLRFVEAGDTTVASEPDEQTLQNKLEPFNQLSTRSSNWQKQAVLGARGSDTGDVFVYVEDVRFPQQQRNATLMAG
ncbi:MAG: hypothetical protein SCI25_16100, partial [Desulfuromonadales bacterium]|nr:hypothetical protein [Desulfuromonadales bacterium]